MDVVVIQLYLGAIPVLFPYQLRFTSGLSPVFLWLGLVEEGGCLGGETEVLPDLTPYPLYIGSCRPLVRLPFSWGLVYGCFDLPPHFLRCSLGPELLHQQAQVNIRSYESVKIGGDCSLNVRKYF